MKVTLFDLDHTLLPLDSDFAWGEFTTALGWTDSVEFLRRNDAFYRAYQEGTLDIHDYVRFATQAVRQQGAALSAAAHENFMRMVIRPAMQPQALALVQAHRQAGDSLLIITATNEFVTRPIADAFGVDELLAVQLERDSFGNAPGYAAVVGLLATLAIGLRWSATRLAKSPEGVLQFEEAAEPAVFALDLHRDGVTPIARSDE